MKSSSLGGKSFFQKGMMPLASGAQRFAFFFAQDQPLVKSGPTVDQPAIGEQHKAGDGHGGDRRPRPPDAEGALQPVGQHQPGASAGLAFGGEGAAHLHRQQERGPGQEDEKEQDEANRLLPGQVGHLLDGAHHQPDAQHPGHHRHQPDAHAKKPAQPGDPGADEVATGAGQQAEQGKDRHQDEENPAHVGAKEYAAQVRDAAAGRPATTRSCRASGSFACSLSGHVFLT
jgi:hypothetical protein